MTRAPIFDGAVVLLAVLFTAVVVNANFNVQNDGDGKIYLSQYGYLRTADKNGPAEATSGAAYRASISRFQRMAHLPQTGQLDKATIEAMNMPRCGLPDEDKTHESRIQKYKVSGLKWRTNHLTYRISRYTPDLPKQTVDETVRKAFDLWAAVSPLTFTARAIGPVDIEIIFAPGEHGDGYPFDGPGRVLAHAFLPSHGDAHFDEGERWTILTYSGINLLQVAAHEFGHSLGILHSANSDALMAPFYRGYSPNFKLHQDDINAVQSIYGKKTGSTTSKPTTTSTAAPSTTPTVRTTMTPTTPSMTPSSPCANVKIDAVTRTKNGRTYMFIGAEVYLLWNNGIAPGYPRPISEEFPGVPYDIDSALFTPDKGLTYFFKGDKYWRFYNTKASRGYPRLIAKGFKGMPDNIDATFVWGKDQRVYFIKDSNYYGFFGNLRHRELGHPMADKFRGLPAHIDAAFQNSNEQTVFFSGGLFYLFDDCNKTVANGYPKHTNEFWLGCLPFAGENAVGSRDTEGNNGGELEDETEPEEELPPSSSDAGNDGVPVDPNVPISSHSSRLTRLLMK